MLIDARNDLSQPGSRRSRTLRILRQRTGWVDITDEQELAHSAISTRLKSAVYNLAPGTGKLSLAVYGGMSFCNGMIIVCPTHPLAESHLMQLADMEGVTGHRLLPSGEDVDSADWNEQTWAAIRAIESCTTSSPDFIVVVCTPEALAHQVTQR